MRPPFAWDAYSDQPALLRDRQYKRAMRNRQIPAFFKMLATAAWALPAGLVSMPFLRGEAPPGRDFFGMGVCLDKGDAQFSLLEELGVGHALLRVPLFDLDRLARYVEFASRLRQQGLAVLVNVLQDREHIEDHDLLRSNMARIFDAMAEYAGEFQVGNAINRSKWGFFSTDEYLHFYRTVQALRDRAYPGLKLLGPAVIDFEYHYVARALFNGTRVTFDRLSSLLYVDRRGGPRNTQMGIFDTKRKIDFLYALGRLSRKVIAPSFYVTEVNWPLTGTAPYAPTSEKECVSPEDYARYMQEYHAIAQASGKVARVYWHQLIAPGYGLVDNRGGVIRKYPAFEAYRQMLAA